MRGVIEDRSRHHRLGDPHRAPCARGWRRARGTSNRARAATRAHWRGRGARLRWPARSCAAPARSRRAARAPARNGAGQLGAIDRGVLRRRIVGIALRRRQLALDQEAIELPLALPAAATASSSPAVPGAERHHAAGAARSTRARTAAPARCSMPSSNASNSATAAFELFARQPAAGAIDRQLPDALDAAEFSAHAGIGHAAHRLQHDRSSRSSRSAIAAASSRRRLGLP